MFTANEIRRLWKAFYNKDIDAVGIIGTKVCVVCEEEFAINRWQRQKKYCSDRCSAAYLRVHGHLKTKYTELEPTKKLESKK